MVRETKPFYLSSETYATLAIVLGAIGGVFPGGNRINGIIIAAAGAAYSIARGLAKSGVPADRTLGETPDEAVVDTTQGWSPDTLQALTAPPPPPAPAPAPVAPAPTPGAPS